MADRKRKARDEPKQRRGKASKKSGVKGTSRGGGGGVAVGGPRLPASLRRDLDALSSASFLGNNDRHSEGTSSDEGEKDDYGEADLYEYEEGAAEEDSKKNRRYDPVENKEYELPEDYEDEDVLSDDEDDAEEEVDDESHARLLQDVTGVPAPVFGGKKKNDFVVSEPYPESEFNPTGDVLDGTAQFSMDDLVHSLKDMPGYNKLKSMLRSKEKGTPALAPISKAEQGRIERTAAYEHSKKDITKWEHLVKKNREAPTITFDQNVDLGFSTVGAIASEFKPRTNFEKMMASLVQNDQVVEAERKDGARILELNKVTVEEVKDRQSRMAKMRSLLFRHEMKAKHLKKIKSKTYRRLLKKDRLKATALEIEKDPEAAKEMARKQELQRAKERVSLKHKNSSKWAKRILQRGLDVQDEGTRAAIAEQLREHERLTRKMKSVKDTSSSSDDDSSDDDDDETSDGVSKVLDKAKEKTMRLVDEDDDVSKSSLLSLPFMVRGLEKKKNAVNEAAKLDIEEYQKWKGEVEGKQTDGSQDIVSGRRVFGGSQRLGGKANSKGAKVMAAKVISDVDNSDVDSDAEPETTDGITKQLEERNKSQEDTDIDLTMLCEESETVHDSVFKSIEDIVKEPESKTKYDVSVFASGSWKKMKNGSKLATNLDATTKVQEEEPSMDNQLEPDNQLEQPNMDEDSDAESEGLMVDGMLSLGSKQTYELPSQEELIRQAFAGDDVEEDFQRAKDEVLNEENPEPEKPVLMPGWGQWTKVQHKRGLPSWMVREHEIAKRKREEALKKRKDAHLQHVIISEKVDKKAEKLHTKTLPYPFTSQEVFEQSIRMPIGPEYNPATTFRALNRPEVVKKPGMIIKPIEFKEVNPHERRVEGGKQQSGRRKKNKASKSTKK